LDCDELAKALPIPEYIDAFVELSKTDLNDTSL